MLLSVGFLFCSKGKGMPETLPFVSHYFPLWNWQEVVQS